MVSAADSQNFDFLVGGGEESGDADHKDSNFLFLNLFIQMLQMVWVCHSCVM